VMVPVVVGEKLTLMVQLPSFWKVEPQVLVCVNPALTLMLVMETLKSLLFVAVMV